MQTLPRPRTINAEKWMTGWRDVGLVIALRLDGTRQRAGELRHGFGRQGRCPSLVNRSDVPWPRSRTSSRLRMASGGQKGGKTCRLAGLRRPFGSQSVRTPLSAFNRSEKERSDRRQQRRSSESGSQLSPDMSGLRGSPLSDPLRAQSALMPTSRMTLPHFCRSPLINRSSSDGGPPTGM